jgi:Mn2+/Fe2+ NRAMP family transporter
MVALVGWMPSAIDVSVWQSLWTLDRARDAGDRPSARASSLDFHLGYLGTALLAFCFLALGAAVLHGREAPLSPRPAEFAAQVVDLYASTLGPWSRPIIGAAALLTMLSTLLTVLDGFPRALTVLGRRFLRPEGEGDEGPADRSRPYWLWLAALALGAFAVLSLLGRSLPLLVDVATTLSFLSAPLLAILNHRAVTGADVPPGGRPAAWLLVASLAAIAFQLAFAAVFVASRLS